MRSLSVFRQLYAIYVYIVYSSTSENPHVQPKRCFSPKCTRMTLAEVRAFCLCCYSVPLRFFFFLPTNFFSLFFLYFTSFCFLSFRIIRYTLLMEVTLFFMRAHCLSQSNRVKNKKKDQRQRLLYVMADISRHRWACIPHCADFNGNVGTTFFPSSLLV